MVSLSVSSEFIAITFADKVVALRRLPDDKLSEEQVLLIGSEKANKTVTDGATLAVCSAVSRSGKYLAAASGKQLLLWETDGWKVLGTKSLVRAASSVAFTASEDRILLADKSGDAYMFKIDDFQSGDRAIAESGILLGHVSMLLRINSTHDDRYVITSDRDEKIRVSHLPNAYNIQTYCMGHTDAVTCMDLPLSLPEVLISGSSDGTVRYWEYRSGKELLMYDCSVDDENAIVDLVSVPINSNSVLVCLILKKKKFIRLLRADVTENSCKCSHLEDVPIECKTPLSLATNGKELFLLSVDSPKFVTAFKVNGQSLEPCMVLNNILIDIMQKFNDDFTGVTENNTDDGLFTYLNKRKIDDTQDYYRRKQERLLCSNSK